MSNVFIHFILRKMTNRRIDEEHYRKLKPMTRSCIEVKTLGHSPNSSLCLPVDPVREFALLLGERHGSSEDVDDYNIQLLENLIQNNQISKSSIIWQQGKIKKIYGFRAGNRGKIEFDLTEGNSPDRKAKKYITSTPPINMCAVKNAIIKSKQAAM